MKAIVLFYSLYIMYDCACTFLAHGQGLNMLYKIVFSKYNLKLISLN